jgi:hypothetical protein
VIFGGATIKGKTQKVTTPTCSFYCFRRHGLDSCAGRSTLPQFGRFTAAKIYGDHAKIYGASPQLFEDRFEFDFRLHMTPDSPDIKPALCPVI